MSLVTPMTEEDSGTHRPGLTKAPAGTHARLADPCPLLSLPRKLIRKW